MKSYIKKLFSNYEAQEHMEGKESNERSRRRKEATFGKHQSEQKKAVKLAFRTQCGRLYHSAVQMS
jgi:hypothetical protein